MAEHLLEVADLEVYYGVINALKGISFHVDKGEIVSLIGANGAGKTTTLHTVTGLIRPRNGSIVYKGVDIRHTPAHKIVSMGMVHVPEGRRVFQNLTVYENLLMGAYSQKDKAKIAKNMEL
ncbi:MAG: ATP-binding cassette domain-containing protein, partial [Clostridia bacterium]|nr:ATP-binding cassette domain-containing protein [Clostridia bacterium]